MRNKQVFISYSQQDKFFGELLELKLSSTDVEVWRDVSSLVPGEEWRNSIDVGINNCLALVLVLSEASCTSQYVTYEWSYALGRGKPIIPVLLSDCNRHPKIEPIQYIDFRNHSDSTWQMLLDRIAETVGAGSELPESYSLIDTDERVELDLVERVLESKIVAYLQKRGLRLVSYERVMQSIDHNTSQEKLEQLSQKSTLLRGATLKGFKPGFALL